MKKEIMMLVLFTCPILVFGQGIKSGRYVGYEQNPFCYNNCTINYDSATEKKTSKWYYQIILTVTDSLSTIEKIPAFIFETDKMVNPLYDSAHGGYYKYNVTISKNEISGHITNCLYCPKVGSTPKYTSCYYSISSMNNQLVLNSRSDKNIVLTPSPHVSR